MVIATCSGGSNGKGSVCAFINSVLLAGQVRVGMFTSPHLVDIRERFMVEGGLCSQEQFLEAEQNRQDYFTSSIIKRNIPPGGEDYRRRI